MKKNNGIVNWLFFCVQPFSLYQNKVQTGHLLFCTCTLLPCLSCQEPALGLIQEVSMFLMQPQCVLGQILEGMRGQVVPDMFSRYFNKFEVLQTQEHRVCKLITDMSSAVGENKNLLQIKVLFSIVLRDFASIQAVSDVSAHVELWSILLCMFVTDCFI